MSLLLDPTIRVGIGANDFDRFYLVRRPVFASGTRGQIFLPFCRILDRIRQKSGGLAGRSLIPEVDEFFDPRVIGRIKPSHADADTSVGEQERTPFILRDHHVDGARKHARESFQFLDVARRKAQLDRDHGVRIHGEDGLDWNVLHHAAICQHVAIDLHRSEHAGNRHGSAHRLGQRAVAQHNTFAAQHVGGDAAERNRQVVKAGDSRFGERDAVEQQSDALAGIETVRPVETVLQAQRSRNQEITPVLLPAIGKLRVNRLRQESFVPINFFGELLDLVRRHASGVHRPNDAAHAGSGNPVHRNVVLFHPSDHPDLGQSQRATTAEREANSRTMAGTGGCVMLGESWAIKESGKAIYSKKENAIGAKAVRFVDFILCS